MYFMYAFELFRINFFLLYGQAVIPSSSYFNYNWITIFCLLCDMYVFLNRISFTDLFMW